MKMLERAREAQELWRAVIPFCQAPEPRQFILWINRFSDEQIERAFMRASRRFAPEKTQVPDAAVIHKYVTGLLLNLEKEERESYEMQRYTQAIR